VEKFEETWQKVHNASNQNQKVSGDPRDLDPVGFWTIYGLCWIGTHPDLELSYPSVYEQQQKMSKMCTVLVPVHDVATGTWYLDYMYHTVHWYLIHELRAVNRPTRMP
jgi:hypothetical protein